VCPDPRQAGGSFLGFTIIFSLAALWGTTDVVVHMGVPEPAPTPVSSFGNIIERIIEPLRTPDFRQLTLSMSAWAFSIGIMGPFGVLFLNRVFHIGYGGFSATAITGALGPIFGGLMWGYVMDRIGARSFAAIMMLLAPLSQLAWFMIMPVNVTLPLPWLAPILVPQAVMVLCISSVLAGILYSGVGLAQISLLSAVAPMGNRTMAIAVHWCAVGLAGASGPLIGGWIIDLLAPHPITTILPNGAPLGFFHVLVAIHILLAWFTALPLMLRLRRRVGEPAFRTAVSRLYFGNPLRTVGNILSIYNTIAPGGSSVERADAVRRLGESRMRIAVQDLIEKLDDPASDVREEAALALGRIGSPDAVDALVKKLADPQADLAPQIARALRRAKDPRSVDALLRRLRDPDRETAAESARALGEIGDPRAADPLLDLLHGSSDMKVVSASSEALARLGAMAAIYEILPRLQETANSVLKNSLAVAVGNLLGTPGEFYIILAREQRTRGGEVERLVGQLQRSIERAARLHLTAQGARLREKAARVTDFFEARDYNALLEHLFDLSIGLAALHYGIVFGGDREDFVELLIWHDTRFGVTVWYLDLLREAQSQGRALTDTELVLGVYALSKWCGVHEKGVYGSK
ncbi:MAG: MFS transporter, partial [bacterium]